MTKKDYRLIASLIQDADREGHLVRGTALIFANYFWNIDPKFDRQEFLRNCLGYYEEGRSHD